MATINLKTIIYVSVCASYILILIGLVSKGILQAEDTVGIYLALGFLGFLCCLVVIHGIRQKLISGPKHKSILYSRLVAVLYGIGLTTLCFASATAIFFAYQYYSDRYVREAEAYLA